MIFSELYSVYYNTVAKIITAIIDGNLDGNGIYKIIEENAFNESVLNVLPAIKEERWQIITKDYKTPIKRKPIMPLTLLQKRWLKALLQDERIKLFGVKIDGLDGVEPLFTKDDYVVFDKYLDGDNFFDSEYIERFKFILHAIKNKLPIKVEMVNRNGKTVYLNFVPKKLEYSLKDDKFRVISSGQYLKTVNLARITNCSLFSGKIIENKSEFQAKYSTVTLLITDERNALERAMLHFAHFEKKAYKESDNKYKLEIKYDINDTLEMEIRILSFGPLVEVIAPLTFRNLIVERLKKQQSCELK